jgi:orotate phosphoribosyltransferase
MFMASEFVRQIFEEVGAIRRGHFVLPSGHHTSEFWEKFVLLQHPKSANKLVTMMADRCRHLSVEFVAGPALGGMILAYELAHQLLCRAIFIEKTLTPGVFVIGRGVSLKPGTPTILVDDFVSTGRTLIASVQALQAVGADVKKVLALVDRRSGTPSEQIVPFEYTIDALLVVDEPPNVLPEKCSLCLASVPLVNPKTMMPIPASVSTFKDFSKN